MEENDQKEQPSWAVQVSMMGATGETPRNHHVSQVKSSNEDSEQSQEKEQRRSPNPYVVAMVIFFCAFTFSQIMNISILIPGLVGLFVLLTWAAFDLWFRPRRR